MTTVFHNCSLSERIHRTYNFICSNYYSFWQKNLNLINYMFKEQQLGRYTSCTELLCYHTQYTYQSSDF